MSTEAERLEQLWSQEFGDCYTVRNSAAYFLRKDWWIRIATTYKPKRVLEVGCNVGANLKWLASASKAECYGVDVNKSALRKGRQATPGLNLLYSVGRELPFRDQYFDLTFTCGVLIHQPAESLEQVMGEIVRCSSRYVLVMEYFSETRKEIPYRKQTGALWSDEYAKLYIRGHGLVPLEKGFLGPDQGFDKVTWVMLQRE